MSHETMRALCYFGPSRLRKAYYMASAGFWMTFRYPYPWHEPKIPLFFYSLRHATSLFRQYLREPPYVSTTRFERIP